MDEESIRSQKAMLALIQYQPLAAAVLCQSTRFERMAQELSHAISNTSSEDMAELLGHVISDGGTAIVRRVTGLFDLAGRIWDGTADELKGAAKAYAADRLTEHLGQRIGTGAEVTGNAISNGAKGISAIYTELLADPAEAGPKLLVLVLSSVAASGGVDGNGGIPDLDIPLMGIGAHRSPFTHSIIIGSALETALLLLTRLVLCTHKNLPAGADPLWDGIARQSVGILSSAGKGASIGIAYHLMVDAVVQPGAYHGLPVEMPMEAHQTILAANSVAEVTSVTSSHVEQNSVDLTSEIQAAHTKYRDAKLSIPSVVSEYLTSAEIAILTKHGAWLQALAKHDIQPTTSIQRRFVKVADGEHNAEAAHEIAWVSFTTAKELAGWTMKP